MIKLSGSVAFNKLLTVKTIPRKTEHLQIVARHPDTTSAIVNIWLFYWWIYKFLALLTMTLYVWFNSCDRTLWILNPLWQTNLCAEMNIFDWHNISKWLYNLHTQKQYLQKYTHFSSCDIICFFFDVSSINCTFNC